MSSEQRQRQRLMERLVDISMTLDEQIAKVQRYLQTMEFDQSASMFQNILHKLEQEKQRVTLGLKNVDDAADEPNFHVVKVVVGDTIEKAGKRVDGLTHKVERSLTEKYMRELVAASNIHLSKCGHEVL